HIFEFLDARIADLIVRAANIDAFQVRAIVDMFAHALPALGVHERDRGAGVDESILEFRSRPPRVERRRDRANEYRGPERNRPFRQVAHDDSDPVAFLDTVSDEALGEMRHRTAMRVERHAILVQHDMDAWPKGS